MQVLAEIPRFFFFNKFSCNINSVLRKYFTFIVDIETGSHSVYRLFEVSDITTTQRRRHKQTATSELLGQ